MEIKDRERFDAICERQGWRKTNQRMAVFSALVGNKTHPGVDSVLAAVREHLPAVTRDSVYRILNDFVAAGVIQRLDSLNAARYDPDVVPHGHFVCTECGRIFDFELPSDWRAPELHGFGRVDYVETRVRGLCADCHANSSTR